MDLATLAIEVKHLFSLSAIGVAMVASSLALPTSFQTSSLKSNLGKCFLSAEGRNSKCNRFT